MLSVRITAAGAVFVAGLSFLTAPARACDDRFIKKCEQVSAAAAAAEESAVAPSGKRAGSKRVRVVAARQARHSRFVRRAHAPRFVARAAQRTPDAEQAPVRRADVTRTDVSRTALARRFQGFIDPQPIAQNAFEALRKPHAMPLDYEAAAIVPPAEGAETAAAATPANVVASAATSVATTPKQDRLVAKPVALELAAAESRPVVLPDLPPVRATVKEAAALEAPVIMTASPPAAPDDQQKSRFSFHGLVLALCGALGAASALRFVVGA
jgi:hypothetical protein